MTMPRYIKQPMKIKYLSKYPARPVIKEKMLFNRAAYFPICMTDSSSPALYLMQFSLNGDLFITQFDFYLER